MGRLAHIVDVATLLVALQLSGCLRVGFDSPSEPALDITCEPSAEAGAGQPEGLRAPAVRVSGLRLHAFTNNGSYVSSRPALDQPFGPWGNFKLPADVTSYNFSKDVVGDEVLLGQSASAPGTLVVCLGSVGANMPCHALAVASSAGTQLEGEKSGPSLAQLPDNSLLAFRDRTAAGAPTMIYLGTPSGTDPLLGWAVEPLSKLVADDVTLSNDGTLLLVAREKTHDLTIARRRRDGSYSEPVAMPTDIEVDSNAEPTLFVVSSSELDVFWRANSTPSRLVVARCTY